MSLDLRRSRIATIPSVEQDSPHLLDLGRKIVAGGKVACLILAGGLGSRLGYQGPKGCVPVSPIKGKTLYQLCFEKIFHLQKALKITIPIAIGISSFDGGRTLRHLEENSFFGLKKSQIVFLEQKNYSYLTKQHEPILDENKKPIKAPNGNGGFYEEMYETGLLNKWQKKGIEYLSVIPIDNPLLDPIDFGMIGLSRKEKADVTLRAISKKPKEKLGSIVQKGRKVLIIDYMEEDKAHQRPLGNLGQYCLSLAFLVRQKYSLPIHWVEKEILFKQKKKKVLKGEKFLFDLFNHSKKTKVLACKRELFYAPLKNKIGPYDLKSVQNALANKYKYLLSQIASGQKPKYPFELSMAFWYPTKELKKKCNSKKPGLDAYIDL